MAVEENYKKCNKTTADDHGPAAAAAGGAQRHSQLKMNAMR